MSGAGAGDGVKALDQHVEIDGVLFYGSPWQPRFFDWAFNLDRGEPLRKKWDLIPNGVQVLVTHGPPFSYLDSTKDGESVGCRDLLNALENGLESLRLHVFGHIHESHGYYRRTDGPLFVNAAICDLKYKPSNLPIVVDLVEGQVRVVLD